jgi:hypothetical protein
MTLARLAKERFPRTAFLVGMVRSRGQARHVFRWLRSQTQGFLLNAPSPWLTFDAIDWLSRYLRDGMRVFEYGSGGSTLFWLRRDIWLVSVEHDEGWYRLMVERLSGRAHVDYRVVRPEAGVASGGDAADPHAYLSMDGNAQGMTFRRYAGSIDEFPERSFDIVLVDGRARPSCIYHAAPKVKLGGVLVLDNADRAYYLAKAGVALRDFECKEFRGPGPCDSLQWQTNIFIRRA